MTRVVISLSTFLLIAVFAAPAQAARKPIVGIGEQNPVLFVDQRWKALDSPHVRYVMSWDALRYKAERGSVDWFLQWARDNGAEVLLSFGHSRRRGRELRMPTKRQFTQQFRAVRKRYPWVDTFQSWNEANHGTQPTFRKPKRAAMVYDIIKRLCKRCTVSAPSLLDDGIKTVRYAKAFQRAAKKPVKIWSLHNHIDANRNRLGRKSTTSLFLRNTRGKVWFTEAGGIWNRWVPKRTGRKKHIKRYNPRTAKRAIRNIFKLQRLSRRRVTRIYVYNFYAPGEKKPRWDSGLISPTNKERSTYRTLRAQMRKYAR